MSAEFALSIIYCGICGFLMCPMSYIIVKSCKARHFSNDCYSISTFLLLILMLGIRTLTIVPILIKNEHFNNHDNYCEEWIFSATPMVMFSMAAFIHTFRWNHIRIKLESNNSSQKLWNITQISIISINLGFLPLGVCLYCIDNNLKTIQGIMSYIAVITYLCVHVFLIALNCYLIYSFTYKAEVYIPLIMPKLRFYFIFIIVLLVARIVSALPIIITYQIESTLVVPIGNSIAQNYCKRSNIVKLAFGVTEVLPILLLMYSFIAFGSNSSDKMELIDESVDRTSYESQFDCKSTNHNSDQPHYYKHIQDNYCLSSDGESEFSQNFDINTPLCIRNSHISLKSADQPKVGDNPDACIDQFFKSSDNLDDDTKNSSNKYFQEKEDNSCEKNSKLETREGKLKIALRQMMKDMGMENKYMNTSSLEDSITYSFLDNSKDDNVKASMIDN